jgi:hypothetical protein
MDSFGGRSRPTEDLWQVVDSTTRPGILIPDRTRMKRCGVTSTETMTKKIDACGGWSKRQMTEALVCLLTIAVRSDNTHLVRKLPNCCYNSQLQCPIRSLLLTTSVDAKLKRPLSALGSCIPTTATRERALTSFLHESPFS